MRNLRPFASSFWWWVLLLSGWLSAERVQAQKIVLKDDQITVDGKPYGQLVRTGRAALKDFSLRTPQGNEVFFAKANPTGENPDETVYYTITFLPSGQQVTLLRRSMNFGRTLAEMAVANQLLTPDGQVNPAGEQRFLKIHGGLPSGAAPASADAPPAGTNARNRQLPLLLQGTAVVQGGEVVATIATEETAGTDGLQRLLHIRLPDGRTLVAEATFNGLGTTECRVITLKDNRQHLLPIQAIDPNAGLEVVRYLVGRYYL